MGLGLRLAVRNLARQPLRAALLAAGVALGGGAAFAAAVLLLAVRAGLASGADRLGADLLVVPADALVNLTPALLAVEPSGHTLPADTDLASLPGVAAVAPQRAVRVRLTAGGHAHDAGLVALDPARDFTVLPWLGPRLGRPFGDGDVVVGGRRPEGPGDTLEVNGRPLAVHGRLDRTGVGPADEGLFVTSATAAALKLIDDPGRATGLLVRLAADARPEAVRYALAGRPGVKVVAADAAGSAVRRGLGGLAGALAAAVGVLLAGGAVLVGLLFSAVVAERRRELGLLLAVGVRPGRVVRWLAVEAGLVTGLGGAAAVAVGGGLLLAARRALGDGVDWPTPAALAFLATACVVAAALTGVAGAAVPAWRAVRADPDELLRGAG